MLQTILCKYCGGSSIPFNQTFVNLELNSTKRLDCGHTGTKINTLFFCSIGCFQKYFNIDDDYLFKSPEIKNTY